ncbi:MAG: hypothetical protein CL666_12845 [Balneola sp.]|nr:hypothetical protein [Balneola sp.]|tara:strand:+ start:93938 stop:94411 length:474 start_codon:yes stop_codon:yes gene_type:complete
MNNKTLFNNIKTVFALFIIAGLISACSNSTSGEEQEHPEAEGLVLKLNGDTIVEKYPDQEIINNFPELTTGDETAAIQVYFIDHDGDEFIPDEEGLSLDFEISDNNVFEIEQHEGEMWEFHVHAHSEGTATLKIFLMHNGHPDFEIPAFPITVNAAE